MSADQAQRAAAFRALHEGEPFVIPNPWDVGSARVLAGLGFKALATTSSGFAFSLGRPDGGASLEELAGHVQALCEATELPVSVDLENGHGASPEAAAEAVRVAARSGAVGGSIEDWDPESGIYELGAAVERVAAAAEAARGVEIDFVLTARAENHIRGNPDLGDTIARLQAFAEAGADVLYAPGLSSTEDVRAVRAEAPRPLNVLARPGLSVEELFDAGAQRISLGGALAWTAYEAAAQALEQIRDSGDFSILASPARLRGWV